MRSLQRLGLALALLLLLACFDPPVKETLRLRFFPNGAFAVSNAVELDLLKDGESNPALERRMFDLRRELLDGLDPWARRFAAVEPVSERLSWEKRFGLLALARRSALFAEPASLRDLFSDTALSVSFEVREDGVAELAIVPGVPSQATRRQRRDMERALDEWSAHIAEYLAATAELYYWLDANPGRARACFLELFAEVIDEESVSESDLAEELSAEESRLLERIEEAMEEVISVLHIPAGQDRSLDELSHLLYDPFPAPLTVQLPSTSLEVEGFEPSAAEDKAWTVDTPGLWTALRALDERWIAPDPVMLYVAHRGEDSEKLDLEDLVQAPRQVVEPLPNSVEVRRTIEEQLEPRSSIYRLVWQGLPPAKADDAEFSWEE